MNLKDQLAAIKPGENYPSHVEITEEGKTIKFCLQSYFVGMYMAIYTDGQCVCQTGDYNNKSKVAALKKDIAKAIKRGATVEIESLQLVKKNA